MSTRWPAQVKRTAVISTWERSGATRASEDEERQLEGDERPNRDDGRNGPRSAARAQRVDDERGADAGGRQRHEQVRPLDGVAVRRRETHGEEDIRGRDADDRERENGQRGRAPRV